MKVISKSVYIAITSLVSFLLVIINVPSPAVAAPGNETISGTLTLVPTYECIGVYSNFSGDDNGNNRTRLEYRKAGGSWKQGMDLTADRRAQIFSLSNPISNPYKNQWRGSIFGLSPNTNYEVRITYSDADGVSGTNPVTASITTRNDNIPLGTSKTYYVAISGGSDTNPGTESQPWQTIQHAADSVSAGDTVLIKAGTYSGVIRLTRSGTASNYITFQNYGSDHVIINGNNAENAILFFNTSYVGVKYNRLRGLNIKNAAKNCLFLYGKASYNIIEDCVIEDFGYQNPDAGIAICDGSAYNLIQNCTITSNRHGYSDALHREGAISMWKGPSLYPGRVEGAGEGNVIRNNYFYAVDGGISDGVGGIENEKYQDGPYKDCDIYNNTIGPVEDDGLELEGGDINVRAWNNTIYSARSSGWGCAPVCVGPLYVFRNTFYNLRGIMNKVGDGTMYNGPGYFYHNSIYINVTSPDREEGVSPAGGPKFSNLTYKNNIIRCTSWVYDIPIDSISANNMFDYNLVYNANYDNYIRWGGKIYQHGDLVGFRTATGQELNGINDDPKYLNPGNGDLHLQASSPCIDQGLLIPGFNDADSPWPYRGNAPDIGAFEYNSGASTNNPPVAMSDVYSTNENTALNVSTPGLLSNDTDINGDSLTARLVTNPAHGTLTLNTNGSFTYTPSSGYAGLDYFNYRVYDSHVNSNIATVTIAIGNITPPPNSGGDGGNSGEDDEIYVPTGVTSVLGYATQSGRFIVDVTAESIDDTVKLSIPKDTVGLNSAGQPLRYISIKEYNTLTILPASCEKIGLVYEFSPAGATFDPPVDLIFKYSDSALPEGISARNLVLAKYSLTTQQWQNYESTVDIQNNTVTAQINGFSIFAVLAYTRPSCFAITDFNVTPQEVEPGNEAIISATITNTGDLVGSYIVNLELDEAIVQSKEITLYGGDSEVVSFVLKPDIVGEYHASIADALAVFYVKKPLPPAAFSISNLTISPAEINLGDSVSISALVMNAGETSGRYVATMQVNNAIIQTKEIILDSGTQVIVEFNFTPETDGQYQVDVNGLSATYIVKVPALQPSPVNYKISDFKVSPRYSVSTGKLSMAEITFVLNEPYQPSDDVSLTMTVFLDGELLETVPLLTLNQLQPGETMGVMNYVPASGWETGTYVFQTELSEGDGIIQNVRQEKLTLIHESLIKAINWGSLGVIIGTSLILVTIAVFTVLYHRRDMLKGYLD